MSTRYVWGRYSISTTYEIQLKRQRSLSQNSSEDLLSVSGGTIPSASRPYVAEIAPAGDWEKYINQPIAEFSQVGALEVNFANQYSTGAYFTFASSPISTKISDGTYLYFNNSYQATTRNAIQLTDDGSIWEAKRKNSYTDIVLYQAQNVAINSKGDKVSDVSGSSQGPYPPCPAAPPGSWEPFGSALPRYQGPGLFRHA